jgi:putative peptidoglycan lipid II flippase
MSRIPGTSNAVRLVFSSLSYNPSANFKGRNPINRYLIKNTGITSICAASGALSGMVLDATVVGLFGVGGQTDAFFAALAVPLLISAAIEAQGYQVVVPLITQSLEMEGVEKTWTWMGNLLTTSVLVIAPLCLVGLALGPMLLPLQIPGLPADIVRTSIGLNAILSWLVLTKTVNTILGSLLNSLHNYLVPSSGKFVANSVAIVVVILLSPRLGIYALAFGLLIGDVIQVIVKLATAIALGFRYRFICAFDEPRLRSVYRSFSLPFLGHGLGEARVLLENYLVSYLGGGSLSILRYATKIVQAITGIVVGGVAATTLPLASSCAAANDVQGMKRHVLDGIKVVAFVAVPVSLWLLFNGKALVILTFARGRFTATDAALVSSLMMLMVPYIVLSRLISIIQTPFYATQRFRVPVWSTVVFCIVNPAITLLLMPVLKLYAFPIALTIGTLATVVFMSTLSRRVFGPLGWLTLRSFAARLIGASALMVASFFIVAYIAPHPVEADLYHKIVSLTVVTLAGMATYSIASFFLGLIDYAALLAPVRPPQARIRPLPRNEVRSTAP